jgi:hypothetical protein
MKKTTASRYQRRKEGRILLNPADPCQLVSASTFKYNDLQSVYAIFN